MEENCTGGGPIPDGWELIRDSDQKLSYYCPATAQHFFTYEDLMRYVKYAKEAKLSIYAPDFESNELRRKPIRRRRKTNSAAKRKQLLGESSRPLPVKQGKSTDPTVGTETAESADLKMTIEDGEEPGTVPAETPAGEKTIESSFRPLKMARNLEPGTVPAETPTVDNLRF